MEQHGARDDSNIRMDEDIDLMVRTREGDRSAYEKVYRRYVGIVASFLARHNGHRHTCEDLTQEVFARVWQHRNRYQPLAPVKNYLLGVAANVLREDRAKSHKIVPLGTGDPNTLADTRRFSPPSQAQSAEQFAAIRTLMTSLPNRQRQAVELVYLAGLSPGEAAQRLGCSRRTLYSQLCAARERVRHLARRTQKE